MKFAHLADCHVGGWREPALKELGILSFEKAIDYCIEQNTAFILISGDLLDTSLPDINVLKRTAGILEKVREKDISVYIIPGGHDFSPSGKTMLDVLSHSGLVQDVSKLKDNKLQFTIDKTNTKITGLMGLKGSLDSLHYKNLEKAHLEQEQGFKIFMFHTALSEYAAKEFNAQTSKEDLPKNFDYYAGGHVHVIEDVPYDKGKIAYPGPLFPNNFKELEELKHGRFIIVDDKLNITRIPINLKETITHKIDANSKTPEQITDELLKIKDVKDKIILLRIEGTLASGKVGDIDFQEVEKNLDDSYAILKNIHKLTTKEMQEIEMEEGDVNEIETKVIEEYKGQFEIKEDIPRIILTLDKEKEEGEKNIDFEQRVIKDLIQQLNLEYLWK